MVRRTIGLKTNKDMARYILTKKKNRLNREKDGLWYAEPKTGRCMRSKTLCRMATKNLTLSAVELELALGILANYLPGLLAQGNLVQLGHLGTLRLEFGSEGVREPEEFTARCIRRPRVVFQPSKEFAGDVLRQLRFELDGLTAEGVAFASVESYRKWKEMKNVE